MPKESKRRSVSDRCKASPYPCSSKSSKQSLPEPPLEDVKEWEEARCPVCIEHPHNAVLLLCSSHDKGCRPYMCDTSYRHSNCLDQFRKSFTESPSVTPNQEETVISSATPPEQISERMNLLEETSVEDALNTLGPVQPVPCEHKVPQKLVCPLCRGQVNGWVVMESARKFMNSKSRSCACETCSFSGNYSDLRKHARTQHPLVRPSVVDPERQQAWRTLERERDLGDVLSTMRSVLLEERATDGVFDDPSDSIFTVDQGSLLTVIFFFRFFRPASGSGSESLSGNGSGSAGATGGNNSSSRFSFSTARRQSRSRRQSRNHRRTDTLWGETYETDNDSARDDDDVSLESWPESWGHSERSQR